MHELKPPTEAEQNKAVGDAFTAWMNRAEVRALISLLPPSAGAAVPELLPLLLRGAFSTGFDAGVNFVSQKLLEAVVVEGLRRSSEGPR